MWVLVGNVCVGDILTSDRGGRRSGECSWSGRIGTLRCVGHCIQYTNEYYVLNSS